VWPRSDRSSRRQQDGAERRPAITGEAPPEPSSGELLEILHRHEQRRRLYPRAVLVGAMAGLLAVSFQWTLAGVEALRHRMLLWTHQYPDWSWLVPMLLSAVGASVAISLVRDVAPEAAGSGIPHLKAVVMRLRSMAWKRILGVKFIGGVLAIGSGFGLGREGPTVQMGGAVGEAVSRWLKVTPRQRQTLITAGGGAGLAAAFNAPLAGLVFVLEEIQRDFSAHVFGAAFVAAVTADVVTRSLTTQLPVFHVPAYPTPPLATLPAFLALGLSAGVLGVAFNRALLGTLDLFAQWGAWASRFGTWPGKLSLGVIGAAIGLLGWFLPSVVGSGNQLADMILEGGIGLASIPLWFALRFGLTMVSYGSGAPGGIFTPLLVLGALIGLGVGKLTYFLIPWAVDHPQGFAVVGMAAYFAAIVRTPLTGIVLIIEMTNSYQQMLALLVACFSAYLIAEALGDRPIYDSLLERDLRRDGQLPDLQEAVVLELQVQPNSPFDGKLVQELGLPPGCILVTRRQGLQETVPTANTRLEGGDRLTAVVSPQASAAIPLLWEGCESAHEPSPSTRSTRPPYSTGGPP
jgi:chloride channel protein, CIC family